MARTCILVCFFRLLKVFSLYSLPLFICKVKRAFSERFIFKDVHKQRALARLFIHAFLILLYHASPLSFMQILSFFFPLFFCHIWCYFREKYLILRESTLIVREYFRALSPRYVPGGVQWVTLLFINSLWFDASLRLYIHMDSVRCAKPKMNGTYITIR